MIGERSTEWVAKLGKEVQTVKTPKYEESKLKAMDIIKKGTYGVSEGDFWILKNATKSGKLQYTGLIISHAGCLKINDAMPDYLKVKPECFSCDKDGWGGSLVYTYCCPEQGIYEVGEVNKDNVQNDYPYAMAFKRCFDRVVLKLSKLNYAGIYSEVEADEFKRAEDEPRPAANLGIKCEECESIIVPHKENGRLVSTDELAERSIKKYGRVLCVKCARVLNEVANTIV